MTDNESEEPTENTLVCPFLRVSKMYAYGVEFGMLWPLLKGDEPIQGYFTIQNQDQILLAASRGGWKVEEMEPWESDWFWVRLVRDETRAIAA